MKKSKIKGLKFLIVILLCAFLILNWSLASIYVAPIFFYHNIDQKADNLSVSPENFQKQMKFLKDRKYNVLYLGELVDLIVRHKKIPPKTVVITFDDGRDNNFTDAYPVLKKYNIPATMFVIPGHCGWPGYLNQKQIKEMADNGIDIGSHTLNDVWLPNCDDIKLIEETAGAKMALEKITGKRIDFASYPLGGFNQKVRLAMAKAGYRGACATRPGRFSPKNDIYALKRIKATNKDAKFLLLSFWFKATGYYTWFKDQRWKK